MQKLGTYMLKEVAVVNITVERKLLERREGIGGVCAETWLRDQQRLTDLKDKVNRRPGLGARYQETGQVSSKVNARDEIWHVASKLLTVLAPRLVLGDSSGLAARTAIAFLRVSYFCN